MKQRIFKDEVKFLAKYFSQKIGDVFSDMAERYVFITWEDYGISVHRYEYDDHTSVHIIPKSQQDCDIIRHKSVVAILGQSEFEFLMHKYALDVVQETRLYYHLFLACKRVNKIKAFL